MNLRVLFAIAVLWATSLLGVGLWAQGRRNEPPVVVMESETLTANMPVLSGDNIGFRPIPNPRGQKPGTVSGRLVVKVDGVWLDAVPSMSFEMVPTN